MKQWCMTCGTVDDGYAEDAKYCINCGARNLYSEKRKYCVQCGGIVIYRDTCDQCGCAQLTEQNPSIVTGTTQKLECDHDNSTLPSYLAERPFFDERGVPIVYIGKDWT